MIVVRNCFVAKPGMASRLAALLKEVASSQNITGSRVLTDVTGDFNRVILEYEAQTLGDFEARMKEYGSNPAFREKMKGYTDLYQTGYRELMQVV
jgi:hypothetical protein